MIRYFNEAVSRLFSFSPALQSQIKASIIFIDTKDGGYGTGVLTGPRTVVTAAHNFRSSPAAKATVYHPSNKQVGRIAKAEFVPDQDIALLRLNQKFDDAGIVIDTASDLTRRLPVIKGCFSLIGAAPRSTERGEFARTLESGVKMVKGFLIDPETILPNSEQSATTLKALFHLRSLPGQSGAGIFTENGLLTLNNGGNDFAASGPAVPTFRKLAEIYKFRK